MLKNHEPPDPSYSIFARYRIFQKAATAIFVFFMSLMIFVAIFAHMRRSGATGLDMGKIQKMRYELNSKP